MNKSIVLGLFALVCLGAVLWLFRDSGVDAPEGSLVSETTDAPDESRVVGAPPELVATSWVWEETKYVEGDTVLPSDPGTFVLSFIDEERFGAQTDCNNVGGIYVLEGDQITLSQMMSTKMACMNETQEMEFTHMLEMVQSVSSGETEQLLLELEGGVGTMVFSYLPG